MSRTCCVLTLGLSLFLGWESLAQSRPADFGKQWVRSHDFNCFGWYAAAIRPVDPGFKQCHFNALACGGSSYINECPGYGLYKHVLLSAAAVDQRVIDLVNATSTSSEDNGWYVIDEPTADKLPGAGQVAQWLRQNRPNGLIYLNTFNTSLSFLDSVITTIQPDALMFDHYPFLLGGGEDLEGYFSALTNLRSKCQQYGIPYFCWIQTFAGLGYRMPSESEMRMHVYSSLAAGYKGLGFFLYDRPATDITDSMVLAGSPVTYGPMYTDVQAVNPEVTNLGRYLRFLESTDYRFVPGAGHSPPAGITNWSAGAGGDYHLTGISVNSTGDMKDGLVGFFTDDAGGRYLLFMNMYRGLNLTASQSTLSFTLTFDNSVNSLYRINRTSGQPELVSLTNHQLTLTLPGGTGDLFAYNGFNALVPVGSISINGGAATANDTVALLNLSASGGSGGLQMRFSNDFLNWSNWEPFAATKSWWLGTGGVDKIVYVQYMDTAGNCSTIYQDTITLQDVETFDTDPTARGWINAGTHFAWSGSGYLYGQNLNRHLEEAIYRPLGQTLTQNDNFTAKFFSSKWFTASSPSYQQCFFGFFNADNWFLNGTPDTSNAQNVLAMLLYDTWSPPASHGAVSATAFTGSGAYRAPGFIDIGENWLGRNYVLTYTARAGANGAGQLALQIYDPATTLLLATSTADLQAGDAFSINAFGFFTGHATYNSAGGFWPYGMDNVELALNPSNRGTIIGSVNLTNFSGDVASVGVIVDLIQNQIVTRTEKMLLNSDGSFSISDVPNGVYDIGIKACVWLRTVVQGVSVNGITPVGPIILTNGDADGDNGITSTDLAVLLSTLN